RDFRVTGVQTCALPIFAHRGRRRSVIGAYGATGHGKDPEDREEPRHARRNVGHVNSPPADRPAALRVSANLMAMMTGTAATNSRSEERRGGTDGTAGGA